MAHKTLDGTWDRRLAQGLVAPDAQIDLHGLGIDSAYTRLMTALAQANLTGARVLLVIAGKSRPHGDHDQRGNRRGAIRAKLLDWLAASPHASRIAAIRPAHHRHGGAGAVYVVLRKAPTTLR
ncbi:Smr/MutS family protein [Novosphingobium sp. Gsoil 351]|uniref:Smr/MutS family protein n=1 Tax=Novosphingobium sp. Gsoil 351 TaxID=2675225 RepID=UPI001E62E42D|nr:Smr/MutS family protein [Novosphingobium sp. Gsoil 351]